MTESNNDKNSDPNRSSKATEAIRKLLVSGISTVFMTEEGIRNVVGDLRLPKEAIQFLLTQTDNGRREVVRIVSEELKDFLRGMDLTGELRSALVGLTLEVNASVKIKDEALDTEVHSSVVSVPSKLEDCPSDKPKKKKRVRKSASVVAIETE